MAIEPMDYLPSDQMTEIANYLLAQTPIEAADLCFVFGSHRAVQERCRVVVDLWRRDLVKHILVTGGPSATDVRAEADVIAAGLLARGVPSSAIILEREATNTGENVAFSLLVLERALGLENIKSVIAVGAICSSRRYLMTLQKHWPSVEKMIAPVNNFSVAVEYWAEDAEFRGRMLEEWEKIEAYLAANYIKELSEDTCSLI